MTRPLPQRLGRYQVQSLLATGGMAEIYLGLAPGERAPVVLKVITRERAEDQKFIQMFLDEARVAAGLVHPNVARLVEVGKDGNVYFLAMEHVQGETVRAILERSARARQPVPLGVALAIIARVGHALHYAHERRGLSGEPLEIVHRDVTPSNVMVGYDGVVKLLDFGIARAKGRAQETQSGTVKGKFAYMAPEQCQGQRVDRRADVFSLGILLYELTTLRRAFRADTDYETLQKIVALELTPPSELVPGYPAALEAIVQRAMALAPEQRYQTAAELAAALEQLATSLGGLAGPAELAAFMGERFAGHGPGGEALDGDDLSVVVEAGTVGEIPSMRGTPSASAPVPARTAARPSTSPPPVDDAASTYRMAPSPSQPPPVATGWHEGERPSDPAGKKTILGVGFERARTTSPPAPLAPTPTPLPTPARPVTLPPAPPAPAGPRWALPIAVLAIVAVAAGIAAVILMT